MAIDSTALMLLLNWMSPTFPIGSFAYSHALEQAIADGRISVASHVEDWIADVMQHGSGWNDAVLFAKCWSLPAEELNELSLALAGSTERFLETTHLGRNFSIAAAVWTKRDKINTEIAYPIAAGQACKHMGIPQHQALLAFLQSFSSTMVSVAVRLVPLGQTNGLIVLRNLAPLLLGVAEKAIASDINDIGSTCVAADIAAMQHETLQPRIFIT